VASRWYVLSSKPSKEEILLRQLQSQSYEVFYPRYFTSNGNTGKLQVKSYFPSYIFVRLDLDSVNLSTFQWMPNSEGMVCFENRPAYVPDILIDAIKRHVEKLNASRMKDMVKKAQLEEGAGKRSGTVDAFHAIFDSNLSSDERIRELLLRLQW
jgi:transcription antitermination factor NusG